MAADRKHIDCYSRDSNQGWTKLDFKVGEAVSRFQFHDCNQASYGPTA